MKKFTSLILCMVVLTSLTACGAQHGRNVMNEWFSSNVTMPGVKDYDPPIGDWIFIRNEPGGSYAGLQRTQNWNWDVARETGQVPVY